MNPSTSAASPCPPTAPPPRAALYARVSSEHQAQARTIDSQLRDLRQRIAADGLPLEQELCFVDDGHSGATLLRPALERLRDQAAAGAIDRLYVHCPDRLARNYAHQFLLVEELNRCGVQVVFLNHAMGSSPEDNLLLQVQGIIAEYERAKITERCRRGKLHAARRGDVGVMINAPYGYRMVPKRDAGGAAQWNVVLEHAAVVRQIFAWVGVERLTLHEVCRRLTDQKVPTPRGAKRWDRGTVWHILQNPAYKGQAAFGRSRAGPKRVPLRPDRRGVGRKAYTLYPTPPDQWITIQVPALVDAEVFEAVAAQLRENKQRVRVLRERARYLLQGLCVCRRCGYALHVKVVVKGPPRYKVRRRLTYYRCGGASPARCGGQRLCPSFCIRTELLEQAVWEDVKRLLADPQRVRSEYQRRLEAGPAADGDNASAPPRDDLHAVLRQAERTVGRLIDAYGEGLIDKPQFAARIEAARQRVDRLRSQLHDRSEAQQRQREMRLVIGRLEEFARRVDLGLADADWKTKQEIIRTLVKRVELDGQDVRIVYRVDPDPFAQAPEKGRLPHCCKSVEARWCLALPSPRIHAPIPFA